MDVNAAINKAVEEKMEQIKGQIINQTLDEDHDYIMFKLHKIFGETYKHLENYLIKEFGYADDKILNIVTDMMDDVEEAITGKKVEKTCECDGTCTECTCKKTEEEIPNRLHLIEVITDGEKRITIPYDAFFDAGLNEKTVKILKERDEDTNTFYIVGEDFEEDEDLFEVVSERYVKKHLRIGVGKLLNVIPGDYVGIDVYEGQLVVYVADEKLEDDVEEEEETTQTQAERTTDAIQNIFEKLGIKVKNVKEIANKEGKNFKFKAFKIDI